MKKYSDREKRVPTPPPGRYCRPVRGASYTSAGAAGAAGEALRVTAVSIAVNAALSLFKLVAGLVAHSGAMVSDAVHSASDVLSSIIVIVGVKLSAKASDRSHPYGHERFECVAAIVLAVLLLISGLFIGHVAIENLTAEAAADIPIPGTLALIAAVVSIAVKEAMYRYTVRCARRLDSDALRADAWHHRSDALSSVGALVGIAGARMGLHFADAAASLVICLFIVKAAYDIFAGAVGKLVDRSCSAETERQIADCAAAEEGVIGVDLIRTRVFGSRIYVELEIRADGALSLAESHAIAERVHAAVEARFEKVKHVTVCVNPAPRGE